MPSLNALNLDGTVRGLNDIRIVIDTPSDGQILKYDAATGKWINANGGSGGVASLGDIPDVELTNLSDGQMIRYNATTQKWENVTLESDFKVGTSTSGATDDTLYFIHS